jgi:hypothetical protein
MKIMGKVVFALFLVVMLLPQQAGAYLTYTYSSDSDFLSSAEFTKYFGGNVRWGGTTTWEYAIVDGPEYHAFDEQHYNWVHPGANQHNYEFTYDGSTHLATLHLNVGSDNSQHDVSAELLKYSKPINALAIRARAGLQPGDADIATLFGDIAISLQGAVSLNCLMISSATLMPSTI